MCARRYLYIYLSLCFVFSLGFIVLVSLALDILQASIVNETTPQKCEVYKIYETNRI